MNVKKICRESVDTAQKCSKMRTQFLTATHRFLYELECSPFVKVFLRSLNSAAPCARRNYFFLFLFRIGMELRILQPRLVGHVHDVESSCGSGSAFNPGLQLTRSRRMFTLTSFTRIRNTACSIEKREDNDASLSDTENSGKN